MQTRPLAPLIERVCAWCNAQMGFSSWCGAADDDATHGICEDCTEQLFQSLREPRQAAPRQLLTSEPLPYRRSA